MQKNIAKIGLVPVLLAVLFFALAVQAQEATPTVEVQSEPQVVFPIPELGNCSDKQSCKAYCNVAENQAACVAYAEAHNLMTKVEITKAKKFIAEPGPGGCKGAQECKAYCSLTSNVETCTTFAIKKGFISNDQALKTKKIVKILENGGPGGCRSGEECKAYCQVEEHQNECRAFAEKNGLLAKEKIKAIEMHERFKAKITEIGGPGGCKNEGECKAYCSVPENVQACIDFAVKNGKISETDAEQKILKFEKKFNDLLIEQFPRPGESSSSTMYMRKPMRIDQGSTTNFRGRPQGAGIDEPGQFDARGRSGEVRRDLDVRNERSLMPRATSTMQRIPVRNMGPDGGQYMPGRPGPQMPPPPRNIEIDANGGPSATYSAVEVLKQIFKKN